MRRTSAQVRIRQLEAQSTRDQAAVRQQLRSSERRLLVNSRRYSNKRNKPPSALSMLGSVLLLCLIGIGFAIFYLLEFSPAVLAVALVCALPFTASVSKNILLTEAETAELREAEDLLRKNQVRLREIEAQASSVNLRHNVDGSFDRRSRLGMDLNEEFQRLQPETEFLEATIKGLRTKPLVKYRRWVNSRALQYTLLLVTPLSVVTYFALLYFADERIDSVSNLLEIVHANSSNFVYEGLATYGLVATTFLISRLVLGASNTKLKTEVDDFARGTAL